MKIIMIIIFVLLKVYLSIFVLFIYLFIYLFIVYGTTPRAALVLTVVSVFFSRLMQFEKKSYVNKSEKSEICFQ